MYTAHEYFLNRWASFDDALRYTPNMILYMMGVYGYLPLGRE